LPTAERQNRFEEEQKECQKPYDRVLFDEKFQIRSPVTNWTSA